MGSGNSVAATVLGTIGTILWCIQLIPQIIYNYRRKNCEGLPPIMLFLWAISGVPFSIYLCSINAEIALQVQPQLFTVFCYITWIQSLYYPPTSMPRKKIIILGVFVIAVALGLEIGFIIPLKELYVDKGVTWPTLVFGIIASVLLALGLIPPYFELAKRQGRVIGINFIFLAIDSMGAIFSLASVCVENGSLNIMSVVLYALVLCMELGIFCSQGIWLLRFKVFGRKDSNQDEEEKKYLEEEEEIDAKVSYPEKEEQDE
ncbi:hypothetical protein PACTADRAFT_34873 [Pachysolen tannophilus NRRL Y-2460]|uniref:PQ-loop repeat-containing protein n=1 Tax=Pachysolen tannophilus NRRL Y-2460 TaxID=669874 RepID=A0A1E4TQR5_PACTA|nr:hypothetical protein PACTADRAFT_34873 [Pachysolen tannophilus NRRL Y-2460]